MQHELSLQTILQKTLGGFDLNIKSYSARKREELNKNCSPEQQN